jgi:hypothetical protein
MDFNPYTALVLWNNIAMWLMRVAMFLNRLGYQLLSTDFFLIGWLIGHRAKATRLWLKQEGY